MAHKRQLHRILSLEPTLSMYGSAELTGEYLAKPWRQYLSHRHYGVDDLVERFLGVHAEILEEGEYGYAHTPLAVVWFEIDQSVVRGAVYGNGAVLLTTKAKGEDRLALLVSERTAEQWGYPAEFYSPYHHEGAPSA